MNRTARLNDYLSLRYAAAGLPLTQILSQRIGAVAAYAAQQLRLSPSTVTLLGVATFLCGAVAYIALPPTPAAALACALIWQVGYGLDCADGQLARATGQTSAYGAWIDMASDHFRNVVLGCAVAIWLIESGAWPRLALVATALAMAGLAVELHTVTALRADDATRRMQTRGIRTLLRRAFVTLMDAPSYLLLLALLRPWPGLLLPVLALMGCGYLFLGVYQAQVRLRGV